MSRQLQQSTAANVMVFLVLSSDHITGATGKTLTITASKNGSAFASISPTVVERGNGWYSLALTSSHTDTEGDLALRITATSCDPTNEAMQVTSIPNAVLDEAYAGHTTAGTVGEVLGDLAAKLAAGGLSLAARDADGNLQLTEGDAYNGTQKPKIPFDVDKDYTTGYTVELIIWRPARTKGGTKTVLKTASATVTSAVLIEVSATATFDDDIATYERQ